MPGAQTSRSHANVTTQAALGRHRTRALASLNQRSQESTQSMGTTTATIDNAQAHGCASFGNQEREMAETLSRYLPSFHRHAFRYLGNVADAEDAVQDALLSASKHIGQFRGEARLSTWLTAIVINSARMQLRRRPRQAHVSLDEHPESERYA